MSIFNSPYGGVIFKRINPKTMSWGIIILKEDAVQDGEIRPGGSRLEVSSWHLRDNAPFDAASTRVWGESVSLFTWFSSYPWHCESHVSIFNSTLLVE